MNSLESKYDTSVFWCKDTSGPYTGKVTSTSLGTLYVDILEILIIANIGAGLGYNVNIPVHIPCIQNTGGSYSPVVTYMRSGYYQNNNNGGFVDFQVVDNGDKIALHNAYLNGSDVASSVTWNIYYRYINK